MIAKLNGPFPGVYHDSRMLAESGWNEWLETHCRCPRTNTIYRIYGDPAYRTSEFIFSPIPFVIEGTDEAEFNKAMSSVRESVEWGFKVIVSLWAFLDFKKDLKVSFLVVNLKTHLYSMAF